MDTCGIDDCGEAVAILLPWSPIEHYRLCARHAKDWLESRLRRVLEERGGELDTVDRRRLFRMWAATEAVGKDPLVELRTNAPAIRRALKSLH